MTKLKYIRKWIIWSTVFYAVNQIISYFKSSKDTDRPSDLLLGVYFLITFVSIFLLVYSKAKNIRAVYVAMALLQLRCYMGMFQTFDIVERHNDVKNAD